MSAIKRSATDLGSPERPSKRAHPTPPPSRRPSHPSSLRPVHPPTNYEVIYISSASPDGTEDVRRAEQMKPSGGITPSDSLQDEPVNSIEIAPRGRNSRTELDHYLYITKFKAKDYAIVSSDFDAYRRAAPPNAPAGDQLPDTTPQSLDLGLPDPQYNYDELPAHDERYAQPIYKARTWNPLIALAIIRLAEKNLPFLNFNSDLAHLPNIGPQTLPPEFPPVEDGAAMPFLDEATTWMRELGDQPISVVFLPQYYLDGRHALAFSTRKAPSGRLCSIVCTPCTTRELRAAGLVLAPVEHGLPESPGQDDEQTEMRPWSNSRVGVSGGEWLYPSLERDIITWERAEHVVGFEWEVRVKVTLFREALGGIAEDHPDAQERDNGLWHEARWD